MNEQEKIIKRTQQKAVNSFHGYNRQMDRLEKRKDYVARKTAELEAKLDEQPEKISLYEIQAIGVGQRNVSDDELQARVHKAVAKKDVAEHLDDYRNAALADAALAGVHIELQQAEDPGQQIEVHTSEHQ